MLKIAVSVILCLGIFIASINADCKLDLKRNLPSEKIPIYLIKQNNDDFSLFVPDGRETTFYTNERLYAYCPDMRANHGIREIICDAQGNFPIKSVQCNEEIQPELLQLPKTCYENFGNVWKLGFYIPSNAISYSKTFSTMVSVCYHLDLFETLYTYHTINGKAIQYSMNRVNQRFSGAGIPTTNLTPRVSNLDTIYTQRYQKDFFKTLYGQNQNYVTDKIYLTRGHMAPAGDFIFHPQKRSTFYLANAAPQFNTVNAGNWEIVEDLTRILAAKQNRQIGVLTGVLEVLKLKNLNTNLDVVASLSDKNRFHVPKYYFRILLDDTTKSSIVFVTQNNPYSTTPTTVCTNVCNEAGFRYSQFTDYNKGYTICCKFDEFVKSIYFVEPKKFKTQSFPNLITNV
ncbi:uncharacterized protein LOC129788145 [Lutzomyia longipalpis]|uniref:uncharacterized protein LOC129788145 n=1 Tax=Lutzomyia longipalpis TaxID=7200 RepID=UPI002483748B|nr:uncharacterized protein LOC129788145 [Lutzomyia longipalpis]